MEGFKDLIHQEHVKQQQIQALQKLKALYENPPEDLKIFKQACQAVSQRLYKDTEPALKQEMLEVLAKAEKWLNQFYNEKTRKSGVLPWLRSKFGY